MSLRGDRLSPMHHAPRPVDLETPAAREQQRLADSFLDQITDPDQQWGPLFDRWANALKLSPAERRSVRVAVIARRNFRESR